MEKNYAIWMSQFMIETNLTEMKKTPLPNYDLNKIAVLILAAGKSSRFGSQKQLAIWHGTTLIENAINIVMKAGFTTIYVSTEPSQSSIRQKIKNYPIELIICGNAHKGMGSTISDSIKVISTQKSEYESCLILVCDQPLITTKHLISLASKNKHGKCTFTKYKDTFGTPAIFSKTLFNKLESLNGDDGAKSLLKELPTSYLIIDSDYLDIDYLDDFEVLLKRHTWS